MWDILLTFRRLSVTCKILLTFSPAIADGAGKSRISAVVEKIYDDNRGRLILNLIKIFILFRIYQVFGVLKS